MAENSTIHSEQFTIRASEVNPEGIAALSSICALFQEVAGNNALDLNFDISQLQQKNLTWVLHRMNIRMMKYPKWRETVTIQTWPAKGDRLRAFRDYRILDANSDEMGVCLSYWMMLNMESRRPVRIPEEILEIRLNSPAHTLEPKQNRLKRPEKPVMEKQFRVRQNDLDMNNHLNNTRYIEWMIEPLPNTLHQVQEIDIVFMQECYYDNRVTSQAEMLDEKHSTHQLTKANGDVIALAEITHR